MNLKGKTFTWQERAYAISFQRSWIIIWFTCQCVVCWLLWGIQSFHHDPRTYFFQKMFPTLQIGFMNILGLTYNWKESGSQIRHYLLVWCSRRYQHFDLFRYSWHLIHGQSAYVQHRRIVIFSHSIAPSWQRYKISRIVAATPITWLNTLHTHRLANSHNP